MSTDTQPCTPRASRTHFQMKLASGLWEATGPTEGVKGYGTTPEKALRDYRVLEAVVYRSQLPPALRAE